MICRALFASAIACTTAAVRSATDPYAVKKTLLSDRDSLVAGLPDLNDLKMRISEASESLIANQALFASLAKGTEEFKANIAKSKQINAQKEALYHELVSLVKPIVDITEEIDAFRA